VIASSPLAGLPICSVPFTAPDASGDASLAAFALGPVDELLRCLAVRSPELPPELARAVPKRKAEYLAGRAAGAFALSQCGSMDGHIGRNDDGSPRWPAGFVGALTHGGGLAAAAAASRSHYLGIGIDAEYLLDTEVEKEVVESIALPGELARADSALSSGARGALLTIVFSAKESLFKCLYPLVGEFFGFHDARLAEIREDGAGSGSFRLELVRCLDHRFVRGWDVVGRFSIANGRVQTAVAVRH
jgi:enterobactin synthetase component D